MSLFVKICGVTTQEAVEAAVASGADAVGFVFHESSPRNFHPARAAILSALLPPGVASVAVTSHPRRELVEQVLEAFAPDVWQSDAEDFESLNLPAEIERWPVYRREVPVDSLPGRLLFDSSASGTGMRSDWRCAARLALRCELVLAGGLDATNVEKAIASVRPYGVDVSSGVERSLGEKDADLIRGFILAARRASAEIRA
jgi:phosphoribosylanthranilate isomerase